MGNTKAPWKRGEIELLKRMCALGIKSEVATLVLERTPQSVQKAIERYHIRSNGTPLTSWVDVLEHLEYLFYETLLQVEAQHGLIRPQWRKKGKMRQNFRAFLTDLFPPKLLSTPGGWQSMKEVLMWAHKAGLRVQYPTPLLEQELTHPRQVYILSEVKEHRRHTNPTTLLRLVNKERVRRRLPPFWVEGVTEED